MRSALREKAIQLRVEKQLSYSEIRKRLKVSKSTLSYWLNEFPLSKEKILELRRCGWSKGEAGREKFRVTMRFLKEEKAKEICEKYKARLKNASEESLFVAGLMLYVAEGGKRKDSTIVLANTDPTLINFFKWWLEKYLSIKKEKLRVQLHLYENMDIDKEKKFWIDILELKESQFYKISIRPMKNNSFSYSSSLRHGTCSLYAFSSEKRTELMMAIKAFFDECIMRNMRV